MLIIPAIDLKDGCVVRYVQGKYAKKIYSLKPLEVAQSWVDQGARLIHVVDLDGAFSGSPKNLEIVKKLAKKIKVPLEFGGGVRQMALIRKLLGWGICRVILGTKAAGDRKFLVEAIANFGQKIVVGIDAKKQSLQVKGWKAAQANSNILTFARQLKKLGARQAIYTDTLKDGTLSGPNIPEIKRILKYSGIKLIASGGVCSLKDLHRLKKLEKYGLAGVIIGKALYEKRFTLGQALGIG